jgi:hypothetical protein
MAGKFVKKDELPDGLKNYIAKTDADDQDIIDNPEPVWNEKLIDDVPLTEAQQLAALMAQVAYNGAEARADLLAEATKVVTADRNLQYGSPEDAFQTIADMWSIYLGVELLPQDVAALMVLMKAARIRNNPTHRDSWVDIAGYAACGGTMPLGQDEEEN